MELKYTVSGFIYISVEDDCHKVVDAMLETDYNEEFCIAEGFDPDFIARLMEAGFLVMSINISEDEPYYILLPKLHLVRSVLHFDRLHIKRSIRRFLNNNLLNYELKADSDFDLIIDGCVEKHGADWLTPPLVEAIKKIRNDKNYCAYPTSFALYRDGNFVAGEFGVICGKVYTSYSGFYEEANAGTVQIILLTRYLKEKGFSFFDFGMPLDYKNSLGAEEITPHEFVRLFRG
ncbi:MAG: GNAT family N-acetyltransferase [Treponema sp.]|nr:GNAT family N-acetyltransferase [Treponema sp.]MCL2237085.1 GNAT family N-acetyltransferase [Treponema sp.]